MNEEQMQFVFNGAEEKTPVGTKPHLALKPLDLKRAALGWLAAHSPTGVALSVPTRISRYKADLAAFWSEPSKGIHVPSKTAIIEVRHEREQCWPDCSSREALLEEFRTQKAEKQALEAGIRKEEPHLKQSDMLFDEMSSWNYAGSRNRSYHKLLAELEKIEHALYKGSRFERIRRAHVADCLYLAVPEYAVHPDEVAEGWGLIYVNAELVGGTVKDAEFRNCPPENRLHFVQNIASAATKDVFFSYGVNVSGDSVVFTPVPRRRRPQHPLEDL